MAVYMILAVDNDFGIGKDGGIPWKCPEDMKFFKEQTKGSIVLMGKNTFESMGSRKLRGRKNVIATSEKKKKGNFVNNPEAFVKRYTMSTKDLYIIGGSTLYNKLHKYAETIYITFINGWYECDRHVDKKMLRKRRIVSRKVLSDLATLVEYS